MLVESISLPSFPIGCLMLTACCDYVLFLVYIDFLVRFIHFCLNLIYKVAHSILITSL